MEKREQYREFEKIRLQSNKTIRENAENAEKVRGIRYYLYRSDGDGQEVLDNVASCWKVKLRGFSPRDSEER